MNVICRDHDDHCCDLTDRADHEEDIISLDVYFVARNWVRSSGRLYFKSSSIDRQIIWCATVYFESSNSFAEGPVVAYC